MDPSAPLASFLEDAIHACGFDAEENAKIAILKRVCMLHNIFHRPAR